MSTVAEQETINRHEVSPGDADFRARVPVNNLRERVAAAQKRLRDSRSVTATLESGELDQANVTMTRGVEQPQTDEARPAASHFLEAWRNC